ncbi:MAG TPA: pitrilysin family protein [Ignavibacteria bacterium]
MTNTNQFPEIEYKESELTNGLRVVMCRKDNIPMVTVNTSFQIGSKDEDEGKTGLAHLFEHLMFTESPNVKQGMFDEILNMNGGDSNAFTSWDYTGYHITLPSNKLELALWLDSDRLAGFNIGEDSLEIQKSVVQEENLQVHENVPYGSLERESSKRLFKGNGYERPIIGLMEDVKKLSIEDVKDFFLRYYVPKNSVLSVVGDIDYDKTLKLITKYYEDIPSGTHILQKKFEDMKITKEIRDNIEDNIELPAQFIYYKAPGQGTKDYYILRLLSAILSDGESSKLYNELLYKKELVSEIDSYYYGMEKAGIFNINAFAMKKVPLKTIGIEIDKIIDAIKSGNLEERELVKVKNYFETSFVSKRQSMNYLADTFSFLKIFFNNLSLINTEVSNFLSVQKQDIIDCARKYLNVENRVVLNYIPAEK